MIGVYLCVFHRLENLPETLKQLDEQSFKEFKLHILNNSIQDKEQVEDLVAKHKGKLDVAIKHFELNMGPMIRFMEAKNSDYEYVVFLDDDESFSKDMMKVFDSEKKPRHLFARVANNFLSGFNVRKRVTDGKADYLGPGGMIADADIFRKPSFWSEWKPEFYVIDDMWLSYFAEKEEWSKLASKAAIVLKSSGPDSMLRNELIRKIKVHFYENVWRKA